MPPPDRELDVVLFGATGFTGQLVARYLASHAPPKLRWGIAGRDLTKLQALRRRLTTGQCGAPVAVAVPVLRADVTDAGSMLELASRSRLVASTVGPFVEYGGPLVAACAEQGTDYVDITGEAEFVDRTWLEHHERAQETGARLVHCCGFDSVPHDLGARWSLQHLPTDVPITMRGYVRASGAISGGTYQSAVRAFGRARQAGQVAAQRRALEPVEPGRRVGVVSLHPHREPVCGRWSVPLPTIDHIVVRRSARALPEYGPDFRYGHFAVVGGLPAAAASVAGVTGLMAASKLRPTRAAMLRLKRPGEGPSADRRAASWFQVRFVATAGDRTVVTEVCGGDPGYDETAKMLAESAMCLVLDDVPQAAGQLTTAEAMGRPLTHRLQRAGITFRVREAGDG